MQPPPQIPSPNEVLFEGGGLRITHAMIQHGGTMIPARQITSVHTSQEARRVPGSGSSSVRISDFFLIMLALLGASGAIGLIAGVETRALGGITLGFSLLVAVAIVTMRPKAKAAEPVRYTYAYHIALVTPTGTTKLFETEDVDLANRIVAAIQMAIAR